MLKTCFELFFYPEPKAQLTRNFIGSIEVTCRSEVAKVQLTRNFIGSIEVTCRSEVVKIMLIGNSKATQHSHDSVVLKQFMPLYIVRLSLLTMTNPNQLCDVLLFVSSKMAD